MGQIPRSTERISSLDFRCMAKWQLFCWLLVTAATWSYANVTVHTNCEAGRVNHGHLARTRCSWVNVGGGACNKYLTPTHVDNHAQSDSSPPHNPVYFLQCESKKYSPKRYVIFSLVVYLRDWKPWLLHKHSHSHLFSIFVYLSEYLY